MSGALGVDRGELVGELLVAEAGDALVVLGVVGDLEQPAAQLVQLLHLLQVNRCVRINFNLFLKVLTGRLEWFW